MITVFELLIAIARAIPTVRDLLEQFFLWYATTQIEGMKAENRAAVIKMLVEKNQIEVEKLLGYKNAGEPSGIGDIVTELPGVPVNHP